MMGDDFKLKKKKILHVCCTFEKCVATTQIDLLLRSFLFSFFFSYGMTSILYKYINKLMIASKRETKKKGK